MDLTHPDGILNRIYAYLVSEDSEFQNTKKEIIPVKIRATMLNLGFRYFKRTKAAIDIFKKINSVHNRENA